jgi:hypothetical protein
LRSEAAMLRHEVHLRGLRLNETHAEMAQILQRAAANEHEARLEHVRLTAEAQLAHRTVAAVNETLAAARQEVAALRGSWTWKIGRSVTNPLGRLKRLGRPAA